MHLTAEQDIVIAAPKLEPFQPIDTLGCPICGNRSAPRITRLWVWLMGRSIAMVSVSYCRGGRAPVEDIASPIEAMMRGASENRPTCGGVLEPHLHLKCRCCDHIRLMRTKGA